MSQLLGGQAGGISSYLWASQTFIVFRPSPDEVEEAQLQQGKQSVLLRALIQMSIMFQNSCPDTLSTKLNG